MNLTGINPEDLCLVDSATTNTILRNDKYFSSLVMQKANVQTISGSINLIEGSGRANILLPEGTKLCIDNAIYSTKSGRNLLSFKDIRRNGYHIETTTKNNKEYLVVTKIVAGRKCILEKCPAFSSGLYYTFINTIETHVIENQKFTNTDQKSTNVNQKFTNEFNVWHDRLGHPGSIMMRQIIENSCGHTLKCKQIPQSHDFSCTACSKGKLIIRPSPSKVESESLTFLERIQGDICGPIHPSCGPFRYYMVLIDASTKWSHV